MISQWSELLLNIKRGTKTSVVIAEIRTAVIAIGDRTKVPINAVIATTDNTIRTFILFLCPFIYITCKVVDVISTPFFSDIKIKAPFGDENSMIALRISVPMLI